MNKIRDFLNYHDLDVIWDDRNTVVWIDWRERDEDVIEYCEKRLKTGKLSSSITSADNELGYELTIHYGERSSIVNFNPRAASRDATLITLNKLLLPDYQIRFWMDTVGNDTLGFVPLPVADWDLLERDYGEERIQFHFMPITAKSRMFDLDMKEVLQLMKVR